MLLYMKMYLPVLLTCCIITVGYVVMWVLNGGDIDPGSPNARVDLPLSFSSTRS